MRAAAPDSSAVAALLLDTSLLEYEVTSVLPVQGDLNLQCKREASECLKWQSVKKTNPAVRSWGRNWHELAFHLQCLIVDLAMGIRVALLIMVGGRGPTYHPSLCLDAKPSWAMAPRPVLQVKRVYAALLESKEERWDQCRGGVADCLRELAEHHGGEVCASHAADLVPSWRLPSLLRYCCTLRSSRDNVRWRLAHTLMHTLRQLFAWSWT